MFNDDIAVKSTLFRSGRKPIKEIAEEEINDYVVTKYMNTIILEQGSGEVRVKIPPVRYLMTT
jgi:hypothetical protein